MENKELDRRYQLAAAAILLLGFVLRAYGITSQPLSFDDLSVAVSAENFTQRGHLGPTMWNHPGLRNLLVYFSTSLSCGVLSLKIFSLLFGSLSVMVLTLAAKRITGSSKVALLSALFLAIDPLHIDFSRQAVHEVYMSFFSLSGILFSLKFLDNRNPLWLILCGVFFGLGLASKWYVAFPLFVTCSFLLYSLLKGPASDPDRKLPSVIFLTTAMLILPLTIYLLTFIPWFKRGYGIAEWLSLQQTMAAETVVHAGYNPYGFELDHNAYLWFIKPVAFADFTFSSGTPVVLLGISNPFVWLLAVPAAIYVFLKAVRKSVPEYYFLSALFLLSYLPFLLTNRPIWAHSAFSVLPFSFIMIAFMVVDVVKRHRRGIIFLSLYLVIVVSAAVPLYFLATGKGFENKQLSAILELYRPINEKNR